MHNHCRQIIISPICYLLERSRQRWNMHVFMEDPPVFYPDIMNGWILDFLPVEVKAMAARRSLEEIGFSFSSVENP